MTPEELADEVFLWAAQNGVMIHQWQHHALLGAMSGERVRVAPRRGGKRLALVMATRDALDRGEHVHVIQHAYVLCSGSPTCEPREGGRPIMRLTDAEQIA